MKLLALECSAITASVAVFDDERLLGESFLNAGLTHSQTLMPLVDNVLKMSGTDINDIDLIAISNGPGSFTGIRIGVAAAKGLSLVNDTKCIGVSTLDAIAHNFSEQAIICAVMDARRNQFYNALFSIEDGKAKRLCEDRAIDAKELFEELCAFDKKVIIAGDGAVLCSCLLIEFGYSDKINYETARENLMYQRAYGVGMAAFDLIKNGGQPVPNGELVPVYLRLSQAQRELSLKKQREAEQN